MRTLTRIGWISAFIGVVCLVLAVVSVFIKTPIIANETVDIFRAANSFFLLTIVLFVYIDFKVRRRRITFN